MRRPWGRAPILEYEPLSGAAAPQPPCYLVKNRAEISLNFEYPSFKILQKIFPDNQKVAIYFRKKLATSVTFSDFIRLIYRTQ